MQLGGHFSNVLSEEETRLIESSALRILDEMGMEIQNRSLLEALADFGLTVDLGSERVRFPRRFMGRFLEETEKFDWANVRAQLVSSAGIYHGLFHNPFSDALEPWTEESLALYFRLARYLPHIGAAHMLGCRLPVAAALEPLYERFYCWKYGAQEGGSIFVSEVCPYLLEIYRIRAEELDIPLQRAFRAGVYLVPPLKLGHHEAAQVDYFRRHGLKVEIGGGMGTMGATAPATLAGAVTLNLAEQLALRILDWAWFGEKRLHLGGSISVMDMRTAIRPYGRPEMAITNVMTAQLARHLGASFAGHGGLSDAKRPSVEAGTQKALTAIPTLLAGGHLWLDAGLLAIDEVCSPIQMVLDNEFISVLKHLVRPFAVDEEAVGLDTILESGPGGNFLGSVHTADHFRGEHWEPAVWSRQMLRPWLESDGSLDVDKAREWIRNVEQKDPVPPAMEESRQKGLLQVIEKARQALGA